jgi:hypothetical protein
MYATQRKINHSSLDHFMAWINVQVNRNSLVKLGDPSESSNGSSHKNSIPQQRVSDARTPLRTFEIRNLNQNRCVICKNDRHELERCQNFLKAVLKKRWDLAQKYHACFLCLKYHQGHCENQNVCEIQGDIITQTN